MDRNEVLNKIAQALRQAGATAEFNEAERMLVNDEVVDHRIEFGEQTHTVGWSRRPTGRHYITVGDFGNKKMFPERKDGTFSWLKIAEEVLCMVARLKAERQAMSRRASSAELARVVSNELGIRPYMGDARIEECGDATRVRVTLQPLTLSPERAHELVQLLRSNGFLAK